MSSRPIQLATVNARHHHSAFGLRCLWSNLGDLQPLCALREFTAPPGAAAIADALLADRPQLIGLGVYIWNVDLLTEVVATIRQQAPAVRIVVGGPEVSHEHQSSALVALADVLIRGEAELAFADVAAGLLAGRSPPDRVVDCGPPDLARLTLPYAAYSDDDIAHRVLYVESARGCPLGCEFCLSSLDRRVREFPLDSFLEEMARLIERGARRFKFVDRSFNLQPARSSAILRFFREHWCNGMQLHFEVVPDRLTPGWLDLLAQFPVAGLHLEVGVQSFDDRALAAVGRPRDAVVTAANLALLQQTGAALHADLLVGLPGEGCNSFAAGFDRLIALRPAELQIELLKRLRGTAIDRHPGLRFADRAPYPLLASDALDATAVQRLERCARAIDLLYNSHNFPRSLELLWGNEPSPFAAFAALTDALWHRLGALHGIALATLAEVLFDFLVARPGADRATVAAAIRDDYHRRPGRRDRLEFLGTRARPAR